LYPSDFHCMLLVHVLTTNCTASHNFVIRNVPECILSLQHWCAGSNTSWEWKQIKKVERQLNQQATFWCRQGVIDTLAC
jgi:hypothetical protein